MTLNYIENSANKSLEGNLLSGIGSAGKVIGNFAEKVKKKNIDNCFNDKGNKLQLTGQNIKDNYVIRFKEIENLHLDPFIDQLDMMDRIYNKTKEIYFDSEYIYLEMR